MSERLSYEQIDQTRGFYLEDSFVLGIVFDVSKVSIRLDLVLTPKHPMYVSPKAGEQHCYRNGTLTFSRIDELCLKFRANSASTDANGETDFGNIDEFYLLDSTYRLTGDWGEMEIRARGLEVKID